MLLLAQLKINPLYTILSSFDFGNTPCVGTFYDFIDRLLDSDDNQLSPNIHHLKTKVPKPKTKSTQSESLSLAGDSTLFFYFCT